MANHMWHEEDQFSRTELDGAVADSVSRASHESALAEQEQRLQAEFQQERERLEARIRELEAAAVAAAGRGAGGGAAAQPAPAPARDRQRAVELFDRGDNMRNLTVRVGDRDYTKMDCYVESILADDSYPYAWVGIYDSLPEGGTITINGSVYTKEQCLQLYNELRAAAE